MINVLVFGMTENPGGVESFLLSYYRRIDKNRIQFDFLCNSHNLVAHEEELRSLGGRVFHITARSEDIREYKNQLEEIFKAHSLEWDAIWVNVCSLANIDYLKIAKKYGIKKRIIHSHNSRNMDGKLRGLLHYWNKMIVQKYATDFWACSDEAAIWFYNKDVIKSAIIIHNAIDVEQVKFCEEKREKIRIFYNWNDKFVIGNVGRLHFQKNQRFLIDIFHEYHRSNPNSVLVLVGGGEDETKLKSQVTEYGLSEYVFFVGVQKDIQGWLSAFDVFLFPSVFEGVSISALEAQANGLPILASDDAIPKGVKMNNNLTTFSLKKDAYAWSEEIQYISSMKRERYSDIVESFTINGYNVEKETTRLETLLERSK